MKTCGAISGRSTANKRISNPCPQVFQITEKEKDAQRLFPKDTTNTKRNARLPQKPAPSANRSAAATQRPGGHHAPRAGVKGAEPPCRRRHPLPKGTAMKLFEYQAKEAFREKGLPTPKGVLVRGMDELDGAFAEVGFPCVLKSQVLSGRARQGRAHQGREGRRKRQGHRQDPVRIRTQRPYAPR